MKWFKFYGTEYLSDPKMLALTASERSCWITLLSYASVSDEISETGFIKHLDEATLMIQAGVNFQDDEWDKTVGVLKHFEKLGMIHIDNGMITLEKWLKRQETNLTGYERVKRHRIKKRNDNANDNAMITIDKIRVDKSREDKRRKEKKHMCVFDTFWKEYPLKENKKKAKDIWKRNKLDSSLEEILKGVANHKQGRRWQEGYILHATTFLNGKRWKDEIPPSKKVNVLKLNS